MKFIFGLLLAAQVALGAATRTVVADQVKNSALNLTFTFPPASSQLVGTSTTQTLTNKTISGANNTLTVRLSGDVTGALAIGNGGTNNASLGVTAGGVVYTDGSKLANSGAGTADQYLKSNGASAPTWATFTAPTVQRFTSGSGTYTTPAGVRYIIVEVLGGGGGGGCSGTTFGTSSTAGGTTTFGTSLLTAAGGGFGLRGDSGGAGGSPTVNSPAITIVAINGGTGQGGQLQSAGPQAQLHGGSGASGPFGGAGGGGGGSGAQAGNAAANNSGSGGGGAGMNAVANGQSGGAGGAGAYIKALINSPSSTYSYAVGAGGTGQAAGTSGNAGGNGGSGGIVVTEYYQ